MSRIDKLNLDIEETTDLELEEAREILGKTATKMTDEELKDQITMIKYLTESWLEEYEKSIFNGKTLDEYLGLR